MTGGYYRPAYLHTMSAALDAGGNVAAWQHRIVGQSIIEGTPIAGMTIKDGIDATSVEGASNLPYAIANLAVDLHSPIDRRAGAVVALGRLDAHRLRNRGDDRRARRRCRQGPGGIPHGAAGRASRGIAACSSSPRKRPGGRRRSSPASRVKSAAAASPCTSRSTRTSRKSPRSPIGPDNALRVDRVVCAVDCGVAVNPDVVRAQMEGGIGFALAAALYGEITLKDGAVEQTNFHQYQVLADQRNAGGRRAYRALHRQAVRRRRAWRAAACAGRGQRHRCRDRQAPAQPAAEARLTPPYAPRRQMLRRCQPVARDLLESMPRGPAARVEYGGRHARQEASRFGRSEDIENAQAIGSGSCARSTCRHAGRRRARDHRQHHRHRPVGAAHRSRHGARHRNACRRPAVLRLHQCARRRQRPHDRTAHARRRLRAGPRRRQHAPLRRQGRGLCAVRLRRHADHARVDADFHAGAHAAGRAVHRRRSVPQAAQPLHLQRARQLFPGNGRPGRSCWPSST